MQSSVGKPWFYAAVSTVTLLLTAGYGVTAQQGKAPQTQDAAKRAPASEASQFFEAKVRPLLVEKCFSCHSDLSKSVQGGLKLDSRRALLKGGARGPCLVPGDPEHSLLLTSLAYTDKELKMPPGGKLKPAQIAILTAWVKRGAPWPEPVKTRSRSRRAVVCFLRSLLRLLLGLSTPPQASSSSCKAHRLGAVSYRPFSSLRVWRQRASGLRPRQIGAL